MVSSRLKKIVLLAVIIASPYGYARLPIYENAYRVNSCYDSTRHIESRNKVSALGNITDVSVKQLSNTPKLLDANINYQDAPMIPFPKEISDRVNRDRMYGNEFAQKAACVEMFEIDYHKIAYHLYYIDRQVKNSYQDIGTVVISDNNRKRDFLLCRDGAYGLIKKMKENGNHTESYDVAIGMPFGFNRISKNNRDQLNNVPSDAAQCQIKSLPRKNAEYEYTLFYAWNTIEKGGIFSKDKNMINWKVIDRK